MGRKAKWTNVDLARDYPHRWATPETVSEGKRLCHALTSTWFEFWALTEDNQHVVGFKLDGSDFYAPIGECYHEWDPEFDRRDPKHA